MRNEKYEAGVQSFKQRACSDQSSSPLLFLVLWSVWDGT